MGKWSAMRLVPERGIFVLDIHGFDSWNVLMCGFSPLLLPAAVPPPLLLCCLLLLCTCQCVRPGRAGGWAS